MLSSTKAYRTEIDGIRAIAVLSVILAHAGVPALAGGFLGVDVFFVISGYLITTILMREMEEGNYSLVRFYERRAKRILPALLLVVTACVPFAAWLMLPDYLQNFGQSVAATLLFSNNLLLGMTSDYWALESEFKPLLHTWSLGVEEQFYIVYPLILAAVWRYGRRVQVGTIIALGLVSFGLAEHGWRNYPSASFYLPTTRAWELMVGCAIAFVPRKARPIDGAASLLGLAAMVVSMFLFDKDTPSPSGYSAIPVLGTATVILFARPELLSAKALSWKPLSFLGLISYSAYLWHQPLFAFAKIASTQPPSPYVMAALIVLTLVLASLSWRYVEEPFRRGVPIRKFIPAMAVPTAALIAAGLVAHVQQGFPRWTFPNIDSAGDVYIAYNERIRDYQAATFPVTDGPNLLLVGNSFARDVGNVLKEGGYVRRWNLVYLEDQLACALPSRGLVAEADVIVVALQDQSAECASSLATDERVIIFGTKHFGYNLNPAARVPMAERSSYLVAAPQEEIERNEAIKRTLAPGVYVDIIGALGPDGRRLRMFDGNGNPLSPDRFHLTRYGAQYLAAKLKNHPALAPLSRGGR
jgi:peptidoglycan/LPS O-acetylase OafA/YrhL